MSLLLRRIKCLLTGHQWSEYDLRWGWGTHSLVESKVCYRCWATKEKKGITMATQGMVTLTRKGNVVAKIVVGCEGFNVNEVVKKIRDLVGVSVEDLNNVCEEVGFGCEDCRVIQTSPDSVHYRGQDDLNPLYKETFLQPEFNPRWESGLVGYYRLVEVE